MLKNVWIIAGLVTLNLGLGAALLVRHSGMLESPAYGQRAARVDVTAIPGNVGDTNLLYVMDANTGRLIAIRVDAANQNLLPIATQDVGEDFRRAFK